MGERNKLQQDADLNAICAETKLKPACEGMSRKEVTSLLSSELARLVLTRKNAYSYWAHEVEVYDERKGTTTWVDFMQFEPAGYHTATHPGNVERGTFTCYEVKSCLADIKSGHGLNWHGDENYMVIPVELYPKFKRAYHGSFERNFEDRDGKLREHVPSLADFEFMFYGTARNGWGAFRTVGDHIQRLPRTKPAGELLLCMMRAMLADSDRSDVSHRIERLTETDAQPERLRGEEGGGPNKAAGNWAKADAELGSEPPYDELLRCLEHDWNISASWDGLRRFWHIGLTEEGVRLRDAELRGDA